MAKQYKKTRIAAAVGAAALGAGLATPAGAVVVVGGDNGWEVSFDGNVNAFYTVGNYDKGYVGETRDTNSSRVSSGFLPAFFSFNVKSPTVDGMTGSARISFAPTIQTGGAKTQFYGLPSNGTAGDIPGIQGASIDTREVLANISGAFGEVSFGRTLSLFGRNAILNDMTLFGVGFVPGGNNYGSVTFGRVGHGYTYPDFAARFQYTTPVVNGFQVALALYDPSTINTVSTHAQQGAGGGFLDQTDTPRFEGEMSYALAYQGVNFKAWVDGLWQKVQSTCSGATTGVAPLTNNAGTAITPVCGDVSSSAWGAGGKVGYSGFEFVGYYHDDRGLGLTQQFNSHAVNVDANGNVEARRGDGFYVQGAYTFASKTKVGVSYGEGRLDRVDVGGAAFDGLNTDVKRTLWTIGVYHDVTSWLRLIAEYNHGKLEVQGSPNKPQADTFSVGGFLFW